MSSSCQVYMWFSPVSPLTRCAPPTRSVPGESGEAGGHSVREVAGWTFFVAVSNIFWDISCSGAETGAAVFITLAARRQRATTRGICDRRRVKSTQQSGGTLPAAVRTGLSFSVSWLDLSERSPEEADLNLAHTGLLFWRGLNPSPAWLQGVGGALLLVSAAAFTGSFRLQICCTWWVVLQSDVKRVREHVRRTEAQKTAAEGVSSVHYVK